MEKPASDQGRRVLFLLCESDRLVQGEELEGELGVGTGHLAKKLKKNSKRATSQGADDVVDVTAIDYLCAMYEESAAQSRTCDIHLLILLLRIPSLVVFPAPQPGESLVTSVVPGPLVARAARLNQAPLSL
eukprot:763738-Hanusia_phi.AAC.5